MQDDDLIMEGVLIPTQAGRDIAVLWDHSVQNEWSIVGYGNPEQKGEGKSEYTQINDYILLGCDIVRWGAANTKTTQRTKNDGLGDAEAAQEVVIEALAEESNIMAEETKTEEKVEEKQEEKAEAKVEEKAEAVTIDVDAIRQEVLKGVAEEAGKAASSAVQEALKAAREAQTVADAIRDAMSKLAEGDKFLAGIVSKHFEGCKTIEEVAAVTESIAPMVAELKKPKTFEGIGVHTRNDAEIGWFNGREQAERPETVHQVKEQLLAGLKDTGKRDPSSQRYNFEVMLDNYERTYPQYLYACTRRGYMETATSTTALGTTLPSVLPLIRQVFPLLIPYELQSVQPLSTPTGRVHFLDFQYDSGTPDGSNLDDSAVSDTAWADHTEGDTKSKVALAFSYTDITATDKSIYYDVTSNLIQDMQALHGLDAETELISAAADQIARELNLKYLEMIAAGVGTDAGTFGLTKPSGWDSQEKWYDQGLSLWVNMAMEAVAEKFYTAADWMFTTPRVAAMFSATNRWESTDPTQVNQFGFGIKKLGTYDGKLTIYSVSWGKTLTSVKNKMIFGFYPPDWKYSGAVFAPYIPLYLSPQDSDASKNTISRSVTSRNGMAVLQANAFSSLTIASGAGTEPSFVDA